MRTRAKAIVGVAAIMLIAAACAAVWFVRQVLERPQEAYAVQHTAELVVEYMKSHSNQWPSSWSELRAAKIGNQEYFKQFEKETGGYSAFLDDLESRVAVDFTATPTQLVAATESTSSPPFRVIWLRSGRNTHWVGLEPNEFVADYLKSIK
jgi:ABC-type glycerol-3-phosphate transport system substrate-binding protein